MTDTENVMTRIALACAAAGMLLAAPNFVAPASAVGVFVIVCTVIGAPPPTGTGPTITCRDLRRTMSR